MMRKYNVVITPEEDGSAWNAVVPALPGCRTWGDSIEDALAMAHDAIDVYLVDERDAPPGDAALDIAGDAFLTTIEVPDTRATDPLTTVKG